jgi:hypothetical protein
MVVDVSVVPTSSSYSLKLPVRTLVFAMMRIVYTRNREVFTKEWLNRLTRVHEH